METTVKLDDLDTAILSELRKNCKQPMRELAEKLKSHPNTIMERIKKLEKNGIINGYIAAINFRKAGYDLHNLIMIKVSSGARKDWKVLDDLKGVPQLVAIYASTGTYDVIAISRAKDREDFTNLLVKLNEKPYILKTKSEMILSAVKHSNEYNPFEAKEDEVRHKRRRYDI
ncbi:MAG: Lrp/AsnC family transcriptional regulator [Candidatus Bilamarchaeaceae archaeon]